MDDFDGLPLHAQNALKRAGITSAVHARALGRTGLAQIPGLGPLAIARLFPSAEHIPQRRHALTDDELRLVKRWFDKLQDAAPARLDHADRALAEKIAGLIG